MNKLEQRYSQELEKLRLAGKIKAWQYEPIKLELAYRCTYTPDFRIITNDKRVEYHEVKGYMRDDAAVKLKVASRMYANSKFILVKWNKKKGWIFKEIPK